MRGIQASSRLRSGSAGFQLARSRCTGKRKRPKSGRPAWFRPFRRSP